LVAVSRARWAASRRVVIQVGTEDVGVSSLP
jgi:hypothetical protein